MSSTLYGEFFLRIYPENMTVRDTAFQKILV